MSKKDKSKPKAIRKDLFEYLSHLDKDKDFPALKRYLQSPFFKIRTRAKVIELFDLAILQHPDYKDNPQTTNASFNKKMKISYVANLKTILIECIEDYLRVKRVRENEHWKTLLLAESLDELNMHRQLIRFIDKNLTTLKKIKAYTENEYYLKYQLLFIKHKNLPYDKNKLNDRSLEEAIHTLSYYYLYSNSINLIANKMESIIFKRKTNVSLADNMVNSVLQFQKILDPNIVINYYILKFHDLINVEEKRENYFTIKNIVSSQWEKINPFSRHEIYLSTINIINLIMSDGVDFEKEKFEVHKFWIEKDIHKFHNEMDCALFMSVVVSASTVNEFKWCKNFIRENKSMLIESGKNETTNYCQAYMFFKQKKYDDSLKLLNTIRFTNSLFELNLKMLEIKCLFEKKSDYRFYTCTKNIKNFILRHKKLADRIKIAHISAIKYLEKIAKARSLNKTNKLKILHQQINEEAELNSKVWLIKKINEISNTNHTHYH